MSRANDIPAAGANSHSFCLDPIGIDCSSIGSNCAKFRFDEIRHINIGFVFRFHIDTVDNRDLHYKCILIRLRSSLSLDLKS